MSFQVHKDPVALNNGFESYLFRSSPRYQLNNNLALKDALLEGLGVAILPKIQAHAYVKEKKLVHILQDWKRPSVPVHLIYPSVRYVDPKVRAYIDLASKMFQPE